MADFALRLAASSVLMLLVSVIGWTYPFNSARAAKWWGRAGLASAAGLLIALNMVIWS